MENDELRIFSLQTVVDEVEEGCEEEQIPLLIAKAYDPNAELESEILVDVTPPDFGRIAAQTAKQVVMQRMKEVEREIIFEEYSDKVNEIISGQVRKVERGHVIVNVGRTDAVLPYKEQIPGEHYYAGQRVRALLKEVSQTTKGPQVVMSRAHQDFIRRLFELEIPEIYSGVVEIKGISREAGRRTKIAVAARQEGVDPVGSCVGQRGSRIQVIMAELGNEKIDIIAHDADPGMYIANSLKPAQISQVILDKANDRAIVIVPEDQQSLAIGRDGQNVRLAAKLVGWHLDVKTPDEAREILDQIASQQEEDADEVRKLVSDRMDDDQATEDSEVTPAETSSSDDLTQIDGVGPKMAEKFVEAGYTTISEIANANPDDLAAIKGVSAAKAEAVIEAANQLLG
jgi:N utilization substance protein A